MIQLGDITTALGYVLIVLGIVIVVLGFMMFGMQSPNEEGHTEHRSSGVIIIGPIPIAWGVSSRVYRYLLVIAIAIFLVWLILYLF